MREADYIKKGSVLTMNEIMINKGKCNKNARQNEMPKDIELVLSMKCFSILVRQIEGHTNDILHLKSNSQWAVTWLQDISFRINFS